MANKLKRAKRSKTTFTLTEKIYDAHVVVSFGTPFEEFFEYLEKGWALFDSTKEELQENWSGHKGFVSELKTKGGGKLFTIWFDEEGFGTGLLTHEAFHLVCAILRDRGVSLDNSSEEAFSHYLGFWSREIWTALRKRIDFTD